jgi:2-oxoisovalerate dehydrogenase E1 component
MLDAINRTLVTEMQRDPTILCFGEDVADLSRSHLMESLPGKGGVFKVTHGLQRRFGDHRVFNTPIAEAGIVGRALGLAVRGFRPVAEIQFFDYIWPAMQQIRSEVAMLRWRSNNSFSAPLVLRVASGGYVTGGGPYHSQSGESMFCHCPGLVVVMPSTARDAAGLLRFALRSNDPVLFLEHKHLYRKPCARTPDPGPDFVVPFGVASTPREGLDVTVITYGALVEKSLEAADVLEAEGLTTEVIDLRSLQPYDWGAIERSIRKTHRVVVAYEDTRTHGFGAEIAARIAQDLFGELDAPVARVASLDAPVGYSPALEQAVLPKVGDVVVAIRQVCAY